MSLMNTYVQGVLTRTSEENDVHIKQCCDQCNTKTLELSTIYERADYFSTPIELELCTDCYNDIIA